MDHEATPGVTRISGAARPKGRPTLLGFALAFGVVAIALMATFHAADWYAKNVSLPRYCGEAEASLSLVDRILTDGDIRLTTRGKAKRPYLVAAKLLYLVPQRQDESVPAYLIRLRREIEATCQ